MSKRRLLDLSVSLNNISLTHTSQCFLTSFQDLPVEILLIILKHVTALDDLFCFAHAAPRMKSLVYDECVKNMKDVHIRCAVFNENETPTPNKTRQQNLFETRLGKEKIKETLQLVDFSTLKSFRLDNATFTNIESFAAIAHIKKLRLYELDFLISVEKTRAVFDNHPISCEDLSLTYKNFSENFFYNVLMPSNLKKYSNYDQVSNLKIKNFLDYVLFFPNIEEIRLPGISEKQRITPNLPNYPSNISFSFKEVLLTSDSLWYVNKNSVLNSFNGSTIGLRILIYNQAYFNYFLNLDVAFSVAKVMRLIIEFDINLQSSAVGKEDFINAISKIFSKHSENSLTQITIENYNKFGELTPEHFPLFKKLKVVETLGF